MNELAEHAADFWDRVDRSGECWVWKLGLSPYGYGQTHIGKKRWLAHRLAWVLTNGPIEGNLCVLHRCDNRACCNPTHLWLGTVADNQRDMAQKGRGWGPKTGPLVRPERRARGRNNGRYTNPKAPWYGEIPPPFHPHPRGSSGERNGNNRLTTEQVIQLRHEAATTATYGELSRKFGVSTVTVSNIVLRKTWRHLP